MDWATVVLALIGLPAIGSVMAFLLQARREDARRWHVDRRQAYAALLTKCERVAEQTYWNASVWNTDDEAQRDSNLGLKDEQDRLIFESVQEATEHLAQLRLLAPSIVRHADAMNMAARQFPAMYAAGKQPSARADGWDAARADYHQKRDAFVAEAQRDLGIADSRSIWTRSWQRMRWRV